MGVSDRVKSPVSKPIQNGCEPTDHDISGVMQLTTGGSSIKAITSGCGSIRQEIQMKYTISIIKRYLWT